MSQKGSQVVKAHSLVKGLGGSFRDVTQKPQCSEATMFALLAGMGNLGGSAILNLAGRVFV